MIDYEEEWLWLLLFRMEGSVAIRSSYFAFPAAALAVAVLLIEDYVPGFTEDAGIHDIIASQMWNVITGSLTLLLSFRTTQALSRFWEGTGLLHQMRGEWFDSVSCCVTFSRLAGETKPDEVRDFRHTLVRLMSLCHGSALEEIADDGKASLEKLDLFGLDRSTLIHLKECKVTHNFNRVEVLLHLTQTLITKAHDEGILKIPPPILTRVYQTISRGFVNLLNAKKITDTRFPFPYAQLIAMLLMLNCFLTPVIISVLVRSKPWAALFTFVAIWSMFSLNFVASELENPFGEDDNDLPLEHFQKEMNTSLLMLLHYHTDFIAGTSNGCVRDFDALKETMTLGRDSECEGLVRVPTNRISTCEIPEDDVGHPSQASMVSEGFAQSEAASEQKVVAPPDPVDEITQSLPEWSQTVEDQIAVLRRNYDVLKRISEQIPSLLDSISASNESGETLQDETTVLSLRGFPAL